MRCTTTTDNLFYEVFYFAIIYLNFKFNISFDIIYILKIINKQKTYIFNQSGKDLTFSSPRENIWVRDYKTEPVNHVKPR